MKASTPARPRGPTPGRCDLPRTFCSTSTSNAPKPAPPALMRRRAILAAALVPFVGGARAAIGMGMVTRHVGEGRPRKVLFIGVDGVRSDALSAADTPHLDVLIRHGTFASDTQILGNRYRLSDTVSAPGWSSMLTGVWADKHGVHDTTFAGNNFARYPDFLRRLKITRPGARTAAFLSWEALAPLIVASADVMEVFPTSTDSAAAHLEADRRATEGARRHLADDDPDAILVSLMLPDAIGHAHGFHFRVPEYRRAIEEVDRLVGILLRGVRGRRTFSREDWLVVVTSDHGGRGTRHRNGHRDREILTVFLIVSGSGARRGRIATPTYIVDAAPTALKHLGVLEESSGLDGKVVGLEQD